MMSEIVEEKNESPFIDIPPFVRWIIIVYFFLKSILVPFSRVLVNGEVTPNTYSRLSVDMLYSFVLLIPFIFYKKGKYGIFHPLIFPILFSLVKGALKNFDSLMIDVLNTRPLYNSVFNYALGDLSQYQISEYELEMKIYMLLYLLVYYAAFFLLDIKPKFRLYEQPINQKKLFKLIITLVFAVFIMGLLFFEMRGGLTHHFSSFAMGRSKALKGLGIIFVFLNLSNILISILLAYDKSFFQKKIFYVITLFSVTINFLAYGSRSSIFLSIVNFAIIWVVHYKKIPYRGMIILGVIGLFALGVLGELRRSTYSGQVNWNLLTELSFEESTNALREEVVKRSVTKDPNIVIVSKGVSEYGLLYGKSYASAFLFFVPRFLWPDKPHSSGYYAGTLLFNSVGGTPPTTPMEAFWNFHIFGIFLIAFVQGYMHKWLVNFYLKYRHMPTTIVLLPIMLTGLSPNSLVLIHYFQEMASVLLVFFLLGIAKPWYKKLLL